jgi:cytochrome c oxidase cbb3-type subunit 3
MARQIVVTMALVLLALTTATTQQAPAGGAPIGRQGGRGARGAPQPDSAAVARGLQIYTTNCTTCHGANGRGGDGGTDLTASAIVFANDDGKQFGEFLRVGRPERRMPPFQLTDGEVADVSAFIRALAPAGRGGVAGGRGAIVAVVVGDAKAGEAYFHGAGGCTACHSPTGDLKGIGTRLPATRGRTPRVFSAGSTSRTRSRTARSLASR